MRDTKLFAWYFEKKSRWEEFTKEDAEIKKQEFIIEDLEQQAYRVKDFISQPPFIIQDKSV